MRSGHLTPQRRKYHFHQFLLTCYLAHVFKLTVDKQDIIQPIMVVVAVLCVPWMLLMKPFYLRHKHKATEDEVSWKFVGLVMLLSSLPPTFISFPFPPFPPSPSPFLPNPSPPCYPITTPTPAHSIKDSILYQLASTDVVLMKYMYNSGMSTWFHDKVEIT